MIKNSISKKILTISCEYKKPKGGVAQVVNSYSQFFETFYHVTTTNKTSKFNKILLFFVAYLKTIFYFTTTDIQIVHIHTASYNSFYRKKHFVNLSNFFNKKIIIHIHGGGFKDFYKSNPEKIKKYLLKCNEIVALSESWKVFYENELGLKNVTVIPNIIDYPKEGIENIKKEEKTNILFLGGISKDKGFFDICSAIIDNIDFFQSNNIKFTIAGAGNISSIDSDYIDAINYMDFIGFIIGEQKSDAYKNADIYILPSYIEGVPLSVLEAMSYKLPIIATNVGGIPDILKDGINGYMINPGKPNEIFDAIKRMIFLSKDDLNNMKSKSFELVQSHLPKGVESKLIELYLKNCKEKQ